MTIQEAMEILNQGDEQYIEEEVKQILNYVDVITDVAIEIMEREILNKRNYDSRKDIRNLE